ncbi:MAG TPA: LamG domain-containing protein, partial [Aquabacterium sp.]|nr:LamG domain-containing protein [Aquabacterium sp.]
AGFFDYSGIEVKPESYTGPTEFNPFVHASVRVSTPLIPGLVGGAAAYGLLSLDSRAVLSSQVFDAASGASLALIRADRGIPGLVADFAGYDLVLLANLTGATFDAPAMVIGGTGAKVALKQGGWAIDSTFGGDGVPDDILQLGAYQVYVLLIPELTDGFSFSATQGDIDFIGNVDALPDGAVLYMREPGLRAVVDQTQAPSGFEFGGKQWSSLGTVQVADDPSVAGLPGIEVLISQAKDGLVAADGVMLRKIEPVLPELRLLTLTGNPLDERAHGSFLPAVQSIGSMNGLVAAHTGPANGQLSSDLAFTLELTGTDGQVVQLPVTLAKTATDANTSLADLAADVQTALNAAFTANGLQADTFQAGTKDGKLTLSWGARAAGITRLVVTDATALGFDALQGEGVVVTFDQNHAPVITQVAPQPGTTGVIELDGVHDFVEVPHSSSIDPRTALTLEVWFRVDEFTNAWMPLVTKGSGESAATRSYSLWVGNSGAGTGFLYFSSGNGRYEDFAISTASGSIQAGKWYHVAAVMNRSLLTTRMEIYLNGELAGSGSPTLKA